MAIVAIGTDLVALERLRVAWERHPKRFLQRHFTQEELEYCMSKADPLPSLGARFAAKEAFQKVWPENFGWREVWVEMDTRRPHLGFVEAIAHPMRLDGLRAHLSLSHEHSHALAVVVLEKVEV